jgi:hypothetical protein
MPAFHSDRLRCIDVKYEFKLPLRIDVGSMFVGLCHEKLSYLIIETIRLTHSLVLFTFPMEKLTPETTIGPVLCMHRVSLLFGLFFKIHSIQVPLFILSTIHVTYM